MQDKISNRNKHCDSRSNDFSESEFWFERADGKRYYAKQVGDQIILLNSHDCGEKIRFSVDKLQQDIKDGKIKDYGIK